MSDAVFHALADAVGALTEAGVGHALVGGLAVSAHGHVRFTRDADLALSVANDSEAERVVFCLQHRLFSVSTLLEQETTGRIATVRLRHPNGVIVDCLFASSGIESEVVARAQRLELVAGFWIPVARAADLVAMKVLSFHPTRRPTDIQDLLHLLAELRAEELDEVRSTLTRIDAAGCGRGLDLHGRLNQILTVVGQR